MKRQPNGKARRLWAVAICTGVVLLSAVSLACAQSPYATELISQNAAYGGNGFYNDPNAVLGEPTRIAVNSDPLIGTNPYHIKIVEPAYNRDPAGNNLITTLSRKSIGGGVFTYGSITVKFDHPIVDDPTNPYGIDLNVFGNAFYVGSGIVNDSTDMRSYNLSAGVFAEPVVISVSPDNANWYTYAGGPYGDTAFPTQGTAWSAEQHDATGNGWTLTPTDFTKPVNPTLSDMLENSTMSAADAIDTYVNSGGGTGIDLAASGFASIQYIRVESTAQFREGEIDGFADVRPMKVGETLSVTPDNIAADTKLYFQNAQTSSHTSVVADFDTLSGLAKLTTAAVSDSVALAALPAGSLLATYQLDVSKLIGEGGVDFTVDYQLSPGPNFAGNGADIELFDWNGSAWQSIVHTLDPLTGRLVVADWTDANATFALLDTAATLAGDFNHDGHVDAADYIAGRKALGASYFPTEYNHWRADFGKSLGAGAGLSLGSSAVPEPTAFALLASGVVARVFRHRRRR